MAWRDRLRGIGRAIGRVFGTSSAPPPPPPPRPRRPGPDWRDQRGPTSIHIPERVEPVGPQYWLPEPAPQRQPPQPDDSGMWAPIDDEFLPSEPQAPVWGQYEPVYNDQPLYGGEPDDWITLYDMNVQPIEYNRITGEPVHYSADQWYRESLRSKDELLAEYGTDNLSIMRALYSQGYIDRDDWDTWRELYDSMY